MTTTKIEWADRVWNPVTGCTPISEGCQNCYAVRMAKRLAANHTLCNRERYKDFKVNLWPERLSLPLRWKTPCRIFVNSMGDLFHEDVPFRFIAEMFNIMASSTAECGKNHKHVEECWTGDPHTFLILTKRPDRMKKVIEALPEWIANNFSGNSAASVALEAGEWPLPNVWLGVTAENQEQADNRIPILLDTPAAKRFVSIEPMIGPVNVMLELVRWHTLTGPNRKTRSKLDWVILGGETGPRSRPMQPEWVRTVRDQCQKTSTPFFFKQWGSATETGCGLPGHPWYEAGWRGQWKNGGHIIDGQSWSEYPSPNPFIKLRRDYRQFVERR